MTDEYFMRLERRATTRRQRDRRTARGRQRGARGARGRRLEAALAQERELTDLLRDQLAEATALIEALGVQVARMIERAAPAPVPAPLLAPAPSGVAPVAGRAGRSEPAWRPGEPPLRAPRGE